MEGGAIGGPRPREENRQLRREKLLGGPTQAGCGSPLVFVYSSITIIIIIIIIHRIMIIIITICCCYYYYDYY